MIVRRLGPGDDALASTLFAVIAQVFVDDGEPAEDVVPLDDATVRDLLARPAFWAVAAQVNGEVVGGLTAHTLPMTRSPTSELFLYDLAVRADHQRRGIGRALVTHLLDLAAADGIGVAFVPADVEDDHALAFYRTLGGEPADVTMFTFTRDAPG